MAEVSGLRSRNHFEPNCKSRVVDEGKPLLILSNNVTTVSQLQGEEGVEMQFCFCCLCEWQTFAFPLARAICFQLRDPRCPAQWYPCHCLLQFSKIVSAQHELYKKNRGGRYIFLLSLCVFALSNVVFLSFRLESCCLKLILTRLQNSTAAPVGSFVQAVTLVTVLLTSAAPFLNFEIVRVTTVSCYGVSAELHTTQRYVNLLTPLMTIIVCSVCQQTYPRNYDATFVL